MNPPNALETNLLSRALQVRQETLPEANTAERVGGLHYDSLEYIFNLIGTLAASVPGAPLVTAYNSGLQYARDVTKPIAVLFPNAAGRIRIWGLKETVAPEAKFRNTPSYDTLSEWFDTGLSDLSNFYSKTEIDNKFSEVQTGIVNKRAVPTFPDLDIQYPDAEEGWVAPVLAAAEDGNTYLYRFYEGTGWDKWLTLTAGDLSGYYTKLEVDALIAAIEGGLRRERITYTPGITSYALPAYIEPDKVKWIDAVGPATLRFEIQDLVEITPLNLQVTGEIPDNTAALHLWYMAPGTGSGDGTTIINNLPHYNADTAYRYGVEPILLQAVVDGYRAIVTLKNTENTQALETRTAPSMAENNQWHVTKIGAPVVATGTFTGFEVETITSLPYTTLKPTIYKNINSLFWDGIYQDKPTANNSSAPYYTITNGTDGKKIITNSGPYDTSKSGQIIYVEQANSDIPTDTTPEMPVTPAAPTNPEINDSDNWGAFTPLVGTVASDYEYQIV